MVRKVIQKQTKVYIVVKDLREEQLIDSILKPLDF